MEERTCYNCIHDNVCRIRWQIDIATSDSMNINSDDTPGTKSDIFKATANACLLYKSILVQNEEAYDQRYKATKLRGVLVSIVKYWNTPRPGDRSLSDHVDHMVNIADKALKEIPE